MTNYTTTPKLYIGSENDVIKFLIEGWQNITVLKPTEDDWSVPDIKYKVLPYFQMTYSSYQYILITNVDTLNMLTNTLLLKCLEEPPINLVVFLHSNTLNFPITLKSRVIFKDLLVKKLSTSLKNNNYLDILLKSKITQDHIDKLSYSISVQSIDILSNTECSSEDIYQVKSAQECVDSIKRYKEVNASPALQLSYILSKIYVLPLFNNIIAPFSPAAKVE